ncbi:hypothetical protein BGZ88_003665 [Linnemannia elongata]|nr:hypothetical protein BGZ88_003665 [Linnemannia elongata]
MSVAPPNTQAIRSVNINNSASTPPHPNEVVYVDVYTDPITKDKFILWEDIRVAFHNALRIRHKARVLPFIKDADFNTLRPLRIGVIPGEVMDVVVGNLPNTTPQQQQPSVLRKIEEQAARLPKHNPFFTMRTISSTHPSSSLQNAAPPGNNYARTVNNSRQQLDESAFRARNIKLTKKYATDAMVKVAAKMDLNALHEKGDAPAGDFWKALECYLKTVRQSHAHAQVSMGDMYKEGKKVPRDYKAAMKCYLEAAEKGEPASQRRVGDLYHDGQGVRRNYVQTMTWYRKAADQGHVESQYNIGVLYHQGLGVPQNYKQAIQWYLKAARQGSAPAQYNIGSFYSLGQCMPQDYKLAMIWYLKAADQGFADAQCGIGTFYVNGQGVPQDYYRARDWFLKAVDQGNASAQYNIGSLYSLGLGVPQNDAQAMVWFLMAAKQGLPISQGIIGDCYSNGRGVSQDYTKAAEWYQRAADQGDAYAKTALENMRKTAEENTKKDSCIIC